MKIMITIKEKYDTENISILTTSTYKKTLTYSLVNFSIFTFKKLYYNP